MGTVYLAEDLALERKVALKLLAPELSKDERFQQRFRIESRIAASIDHPNVIPIYEAGQAEDGTLFIAMRYVEGADLKRILGEEGALDHERAIDLLAQVAAGLDEAHAPRPSYIAMSNRRTFSLRGAARARSTPTSPTSA